MTRGSGRTGERPSVPTLPGPGIPTEGSLVGVDIGEKRIGVAVSDPTQTVAHALSTLTRRAGRRFPLKALMAALEERQPAGFVIGLPLAPDGSEDQRAASARDAGRLIREKLRLPVDFQDERFTTARVLRTAKETGARPARAQQDVDSLAASLMLQLYLDRRRRA